MSVRNCNELGLSLQKIVRRLMENDDLVKIVVNGKLASEIYHNAKKIYPLKRVEIIKSKVIK